MSWFSPVDMAVELTRGRWGGEYLRTRHLEEVGATVALACAGVGHKRVSISMPPRHGKSETISKWLPLWILDQDPTKRVILASYEANFAATWGDKVRRLADEYAGRLSFSRPRHTGSASDWRTGEESGGMKTAGAGGPLTGRGCDVFIIDDIFKNSEEAKSANHRAKVWDWYLSTAHTRLEPGGVMIVMGTRWHHDDLIGRIKDAHAEAEPETREDWIFINYKALAEEDDPLGREDGEALWPERYDEESLARRRALSPWVWDALYQGMPTPDEGEIFQKSWFRFWEWTDSKVSDKRNDSRNVQVLRFTDKEGAEHLLSRMDCVTFQTVDLASSQRQTADYFVIATWLLGPDGELFLLDLLRDRIPGGQQMDVLRQQYAQHRASVIGIESVGYQLAFVQQAIAAGLPAIGLPADRDKVSRSYLAAARMTSGQVYFPASQPAWWGDFEKELLGFPNAPHDDMVDTLSYAAYGVAEGLFRRRKRGRLDLSQSTGLRPGGSSWAS